MNQTFVISLFFGLVAFIFINVFFEIRFFEGLFSFCIDVIDTFAEYLGKYNTKRYVERIKRERIHIRKENVFAKYNRLIEGIILDFNMPFTLESFTSILTIGLIIGVIIIVIFLKNITLSVVIAVSILIAFLTYFVMQSKSIKANKIEHIMDAEDIICPLAREGVFVAIKKVLQSDEYIHSSLRPYFQQFVDNCENNGYSFKQAITLLNRQLGPKFNNFTKKAIIFEYNERKGMADVFLDIVDENAVLREINAKKDRIFRKMNRDFLLKTGMVILFFCYALSVEGFYLFMITNDFGKIINTTLISIICVSFARTQVLQSNLGPGGEQK